MFEATKSRDELVGLRLEAVAKNLCGGSRTPLLMHLVDPERLTSEEIDALRAAVDELHKKSTAKKRKRR